MAGSLAAHGLVPRARLPMLLLLACYRAHAATLHRPVQLQLQPRLTAAANDAEGDSSPYAVVALLTADGAGLLNTLFGTNVGTWEHPLELHADMSVPSSPGASTFVLLAAAGAADSEGGPALSHLPLAALAAADVWVAVVPSHVDEVALTALLGELVRRVEPFADDVAQQQSGPSGPRGHGTPRQLLFVFSPDEEPTHRDGPGERARSDASRLAATLERLWAASQSRRRVPTFAEAVASVAVAYVPPASAGAAAYGRAGGELLARFAQPSHPAYLLPRLSTSAAEAVMVGDEASAAGEAASTAAAAAVPLRELPLLLEDACRLQPQLQRLGRRRHAECKPAARASTSTASASASAGAAAAAAVAAPLLWRDHWAALARWERARRVATAQAASDAAELRRVMEEDCRLNPMAPEEFCARADALHRRATALFEQHAGADGEAGASGSGGANGGSAAAAAAAAVYAAKREQLRRDVLAMLLRAARRQLAAVQADALATFQADLALVLAESKSYERAASKLCARSARRFERVAAATMPSCVLPETRGSGRRLGLGAGSGGGGGSGGGNAASGAGGSVHAVALPQRAARMLRRQMETEAATHEAEAAELPPRPGDVPDPDAPVPWWKQAAKQLIGIAVNAGQYYFLQYLPAKRADLKAEREQPRGPLF